MEKKIIDFIESHFRKERPVKGQIPKGIEAKEILDYLIGDSYRITMTELQGILDKLVEDKKIKKIFKGLNSGRVFYTSINANYPPELNRK